MEKWKIKHNEKLRSKGVNITAVGDYITKGNDQQLYICDKGHEFTSSRTYMIRSLKGCPICNGGTTRWTDEIYKAKLIEINSTFTPSEPFTGIKHKIKHVCREGHIRIIEPSSIIHNKTGCAICSGVSKKTTGEYEKELFDKCLPFTVCEEYKSAMTKIKHQCLECDNIWEVKPHDILHGSGCPNCANMGFNRYKPAKIYFVELTNEEGRTLWKVGVTSRKNILHRFRAENLKVKLLWNKEYELGSDAEDNERLILNTYSNAKAYAPGFLKYRGNTGLFNHNVLEK